MESRPTKFSDIFESCFCLKRRSTSEACMAGDLEYVKRILKNREQVVTEDSAGSIPIMEAVKSTRIPVVRYLLGVMGDSYDFTTKRGWSLLHEAVCSGSEGMVEYILRECPIPTHMKTVDGISPLHLAVFNGHLEILKILLRKTHVSGVSPRGAYGVTPLMVATSHGRKEMMRELFLAGASFFDRDDSGKNSIIMAKDANVLDTVCDLNFLLMNEATGLPKSRPIMIDNMQWRRNRRKNIFFGLE